MDAFWCIVLSVVVLRWWWKHNKPNPRKENRVEETPPPQLDMEQVKIDEENRKKQIEHDKDVEALRKQGYTDELIAVILPTINNGQ